MSATLTRPAPPPARLATIDDLLRLPDGGAGYELIDGELLERPVSKESQRIGGRVYQRLANYCDANPLGWVYPGETAYRCFAADRNRVRKPDASFVSFDRMPLEGYVDEGFIAAVPDLVAEVLSPNDDALALDTKIAHWIDAGVRTLWLVNMEIKTVLVFRQEGTGPRLRAADTLTAPDILPGFAYPVADLFRLPVPAAVPPAPPA